jgi:2,3-bisphosphoglycerate-dependent phosphoglycerate mutase
MRDKSGPPSGESIKAIARRAAPYFETQILPRLLRGESVLVVTHGSPVTALVKHIQGLNMTEGVLVRVRPAQAIIFRIGGPGMGFGPETIRIDDG